MQEAFGFKRRDAVAEVATRGREGFGELRRLDRPRSLKEERGQHERFEETKVVGSEDAGGKGFEARIYACNQGSAG